MENRLAKIKKYMKDFCDGKTCYEGIIKFGGNNAKAGETPLTETQMTKIIEIVCISEPKMSVKNITFNILGMTEGWYIGISTILCCSDRFWNHIYNAFESVLGKEKFYRYCLNEAKWWDEAGDGEFGIDEVHNPWTNNGKPIKFPETYTTDGMEGIINLIKRAFGKTKEYVPVFFCDGDAYFGRRTKPTTRKITTCKATIRKPSSHRIVRKSTKKICRK